MGDRRQRAGRTWAGPRWRQRRWYLRRRAADQRQRKRRGAWTACTLESDEQDVAGWLKVSPLCQSAGARSSAVRLASPLRAVARRRAWAVGWLSATAHSSTRQTVRAFARQEDSLADDEHHHSCWLIGKAAYAPAYNTDEVSACEAATTGGAAAAVRSAHTVLASPPVIGPHCPWCGAPASAHTVRYRTAVASAPSWGGALAADN